MTHAARTEAAAERGPRSRAVLIFLAVVGVVLFAGLVSLGIWQVQRLGWKVDLIQRVEARLAAAPVPAPLPADWASANRADDEYRKVEVSGTFLNDREALVQAVTELGAGFWVLTPLRTDAGEIYLVNRGFVPADRRDPSTREAGQPAGEVDVVGLLRITEPGGAFLRTNDPASGRWYSRDVAAIAASEGLADTAPFFIDADATPNAGGFPVGGLTVVQFRNNHLMYAVTWFALAGGVVFGAVLVARHEKRLRLRQMTGRT